MLLTRYLTYMDLVGTDRVNSDVLQRFKEDGNLINAIRRNSKWICHIGTLLKHVIEGKM